MLENLGQAISYFNPIYTATYEEKDVQKYQHPQKAETQIFTSTEKRHIQGSFSAIIQASF